MWILSQINKIGLIWNLHQYCNLSVFKSSYCAEQTTTLKCLWKCSYICLHVCLPLTSPHLSLCQWTVASVQWERVGSAARLVDVPLLETTKLWRRCCEKPLHAVEHCLIQDPARHRSQGGLSLWGNTVKFKTMSCYIKVNFGNCKPQNMVNRQH